MPQQITDPDALAILGSVQSKPAPASTSGITDPDALDVLSSAKNSDRGAQPSTQPAQSAPTEQQTANQTFDAMPWYQRALVGAGGAFVGAGHAVEQLGARAGNALGLVSDKAVQNVQDTVNQDAPYQAASGRGFWGGIGRVLPYLPAAYLTGGAALGGSAAAPYLAASALGAGQAILNPVTGDPGKDAPFWEQKLGQAAGGGAAGIAGQFGGNILGKVAGGMLGKIAPATRDAITNAQQAGIPLSAGDLGNLGPRWFENISTKLPFSGRAQFLAEQAGAVQNAASAIPEKVAPNVAARVANGEMPQDILADSVRSGYQNAVAQAGHKYAALDGSMASANAAPVAPNATSMAVKKAVGEFPNIFGSGGSDLPTSTVRTLDSIGAGNPVSFMDLHNARSAVLAASRNIAPGQNNYRASLLGKVGQAIDDDMNAWGKDQGNDALLAQYREAQDFYKNAVAPYSDKEVQPLLSQSYNAQNLGGKISPKNYATVQKLAQAGGADGQEALRYMLASKPVEAATTGEGFSVPKFANAAGQQFAGPAFPKVFSSQELQGLQGLAEVSRLAKRSGTAMRDEQTGAQTLPFLEGLSAHAAGLSAPASIAAVGGAGLGARAVNAALRNPAMMRYLLAQPVGASRFGAMATGALNASNPLLAPQQ